MTPSGKYETAGKSDAELAEAQKQAHELARTSAQAAAWYQSTEVRIKREVRKRRKEK